MKVLSNLEYAEWCVSKGFAIDDDIESGWRSLPMLAEPEFRFTVFQIPADAGRRVALVKQLMAGFEADAELLALVSDWAVWPSGQHHPLFDRFREAFGEKRPLIDAPGHLCQPAERDDATSVAVVSALYLWNCHILSGRGDRALFLSHDEHGWFAVREVRPHAREARVTR